MSDANIPSNLTPSPEAPTLFVRQSSGLVREFGMKDLVVFNLLAVSPGLSLALIPLTLALTVPQVNIAWLMIVGGVLAVGNGLMYAYLSAAMPRSGGEYLYLSRTVSPLMGFVANWGITWSQFLAVALYASLTFTLGINVGFVTVGNVLNSSGMISFGEKAGGKLPTFIGGTVIILIVCVIILLGPRFLRRFMNILFIPAAIGSLTLLAVLLTTSHAKFVRNFNTFIAKQGGSSYAHVITQASHAGFSLPADSLGAIILGLPIAYYSFVGFTYSAYVGGEVKHPARTQPRSMMITLGSVVLFYIVSFALFYHIVGNRFFYSINFLFNNGAHTGLPITPTGNLFAGIMTSNPIVNILMLIGFILWPFLLVFPVAVAPTRNLFAWSFDRLAPDAVTKVDDRFHAPWVATVIVIGIGELLLILYVYTSVLTTVTNYILIYSVAFWLTSWAAILLPIRRPDLLANAPANVRRTVGGIPIISIMGVVNLILFTIAIISAFRYPAFSGPTGKAALAFLIGIYVVGAVYYLVAQQVQSRRGINLSLLQGEIPPE